MKLSRRITGAALVLVACALLTVAPGAQAADSPSAAPLELHVVSFNVLVDIFPSPKFPNWKKRKDLCKQVLLDTHADLMGLQEPSPNQHKFFVAALPEYDEIHFHEASREYTDVILFYKRDRFELVERGHWWLSPTPEKLSTGFGNTLPRIVVWARLKDKPSGREFYAFDTHFDNTMPSQPKMAALCRERFTAFFDKKLPMIFMGDFNTDQSRGDYPALVSDGWKDSYTASDKASPDGRDDNVPTAGNHRIDHIFYHGAGQSLAWRRLESPDPAVLLSDHYPIEARIRFD